MRIRYLTVAQAEIAEAAEYYAAIRDNRGTKGGESLGDGAGK